MQVNVQDIDVDAIQTRHHGNRRPGDRERPLQGTFIQNKKASQQTSGIKTRSHLAKTLQIPGQHGSERPVQAQDHTYDEADEDELLFGSIILDQGQLEKVHHQ